MLLSKSLRFTLVNNKLVTNNWLGWLGFHSSKAVPNQQDESLSVASAVTPKLDDPYEENKRIRRQLALAYRLLDHLQLNEGNHSF